jgi:hypothetical protein
MSCWNMLAAQIETAADMGFEEYLHLHMQASYSSIEFASLRPLLA